MQKIKKSAIVTLSLFFCFSILLGASLGWVLSETRNIKNTEYFTEFETALPTKLLDINGELITEFTSDEKREIIAYQDLPQQMVDALITREDRVFFVILMLMIPIKTHTHILLKKHRSMIIQPCRMVMTLLTPKIAMVIWK